MDSALVEEALGYGVKGNGEIFPYPSALPDYPQGQAERFDWERYLNEAESDVDRSFRATLAPAEIAYSELDGTTSVAADFGRYRRAAEEFEQKIVRVVEEYRKAIEGKPEAIEILNALLSLQEQLDEKHIAFGARAWTDGSGAKVAWAKARARAVVASYRRLKTLEDSLFLSN